MTAGVYRILVTGSRHWPGDLADFIDWKLGTAIAANLSVARRVAVIHGGCPSGADKFAYEHVQNSPYLPGGWLSMEVHPADWTAHGKQAGPMRNTRMVELGADLCLAFPDGADMRGTADCIMKAVRAGIPTQVWPLATARDVLAREMAGLDAERGRT